MAAVGPAATCGDVDDLSYQRLLVRALAEQQNAGTVGCDPEGKTEPGGTPTLLVEHAFGQGHVKERQPAFRVRLVHPILQVGQAVPGLNVLQQDVLFLQIQDLGGVNLGILREAQLQVCALIPEHLEDACDLFRRR